MNNLFNVQNHVAILSSFIRRHSSPSGLHVDHSASTWKPSLFDTMVILTYNEDIMPTTKHRNRNSMNVTNSKLSRNNEKIYQFFGSFILKILWKIRINISYLEYWGDFLSSNAFEVVKLFPEMIIGTRGDI